MNRTEPKSQKLMNDSSCCPRICLRRSLDDPFNAVPLSALGQYSRSQLGGSRNNHVYWCFLAQSQSSPFLKSLFCYGQKYFEHIVLGDEVTGQEGSDRPKEDQSMISDGTKVVLCTYGLTTFGSTRMISEDMSVFSIKPTQALMKGSLCAGRHISTCAMRW